MGAVTLLALSTQSNISDKIEDKLSFLSKSGDTSELTSATGRADIWAFAIRKVADRPLTGFGAATSKYYMQDYSSYTHNLIINVLFSTGVFGGLLALLMCIGRIISLFTNHHVVADAIVAFILVNGLFENVIFSFLAGMPTIIWITGLCLPQWMPEGDDFATDQQEPVGLANADCSGKTTSGDMGIVGFVGPSESSQ
jgi:O-antigen ligase